MPKYGIHHIVLDRAIRNLGGVAEKELQANYPYAMLGAIGPDVFFWSPEYTEFNIFLDIYSALGEARALFDDLMAPVEQLEEVATDAIIGDVFSQPVQDDIKALLDLKAEIRSGIIDTLSVTIPGLLGAGSNLLDDPGGLVSPASALFQLFSPKFQQGKENEKDWYWFEMLHYRRTGRFAEALVNLAKGRSGSPLQRAYAYGYLSHIATDVVGHAYVNQVVGGPYRLHVQRHVTVENFMDTWAFAEYKRKPISSTLLKELRIRKDHISGQIIKMLERGLRTTYDDTLYDERIRHPRFLKEEDIAKAFENLLKILSLMEQSVILPPEIVFCNVEDELRELFEQNFPPPPQQPPQLVPLCSIEDILSFGTTPESRRCYDSFYKELEKWIEYLGATAAWLARVLRNLSTIVQDIFATLTVCGLRWALNQLDWKLYGIYQVARDILAQLGLIYPEPHLIRSSLGRELVTTYASEVHGCYPPGANTGYPRYTDLKRSHLVYPGSIFETPSTVPNLNDRNEYIKPGAFMFAEESPGFNREHLLLYAKAESPQESDGYAFEPCHCIGDATGFTEWLIDVASTESPSSMPWKKAFTNWNLDSDRGYGYKTWKGKVANPLIDEEVKTDVESDRYGEL